MKKRVIIIHGWGGNPKRDWFPLILIKLEIKLKHLLIAIATHCNKN